MYIGTIYSGQISIKPEYSLQIFEKYPNTEFRENPYRGSRVLCERTGRQTDRQTDMTKLIVVFRNFAKALNKLKPPINLQYI
jgi:hypothetical protein